MLAAGWQALERDDFVAAEEVARTALGGRPDDGEALYLLGSTLLFQNRFDEALAPLRDALRLAPARGVGHRLGYCCLALGELDEAERVLRREVELYPDTVHAHNALGVALARQGRRDEALAVFGEAARRAPDSPEANSNVANILSELGRHEEALSYLDRAVAANPGLGDLHHNRGTVLQALKRHDEAIAAFQTAHELAPRMSQTLGYLVWNELTVCRWEALAQHTAGLRAQVRDGIACAPFVLLACESTPAEQRLCAELEVREKLPQLPAPLWRGVRRRGGRLKVAYLSADFREHAVAHLAAGLFERHDRSRFEVIGVSYGPDDGSPIRRRLERAFDRFLDVRAESDLQAARRLRELEVDIAVDLQGHTTSARVGILAHRPAPLQASYLGYPGTTGAPFIDYLFADRVVVPPEHARFYSESLIYLPEVWQVNDDRRPEAGRGVLRSEAGLPDDGFVFCCFNNSYKITPSVFRIWMRLLAAVPRSLLWLLEDNAAASHNLRASARAAGIDPSRIVFAPRVPPAQHLARQRVADLFLDTLPYNAQATASDALWSGLPVLTTPGATFAGRVCASLVYAVGLPELVAPHADAYEAVALNLARHPAALEELKRRLRANIGRCALFDSARSCRNMEAGYLAIWARQERGEPPSALFLT